MKKIGILLNVAFALFLVMSCIKENEEKMDTTTLTAQELQGKWIVSYFWDQTEKTNEYNGYIFTFNSDSSINVDVSGISVGGSFDIWIDQNSTVIDFYFDNSSYSNINDKLRELTENWIVKNLSTNNNTIEFEERESDNPPEILFLTKI